MPTCHLCTREAVGVCRVTACQRPCCETHRTFVFSKMAGTGGHVCSECYSKSALTPLHWLFVCGALLLTAGAFLLVRAGLKLVP